MVSIVIYLLLFSDSQKQRLKTHYMQRAQEEKLGNKGSIHQHVRLGKAGASLSPDSLISQWRCLPCLFHKVVAELNEIMSENVLMERCSTKCFERD